MIRFPSIVTLFCFLSLTACGTDEKGDTAVEDTTILPQSGEWTIVTYGWTDDDCNADANMYPPTSIVFADVGSDSFSTTLYDGDFRIGNGSSSCSHSGNNIYNCTGFVHEISYQNQGMDVLLTMTGDMSVTMASETEASGKALLNIECTGDDCDEAALTTNTGSLPCLTTANWTAVAE